MKIRVICVLFGVFLSAAVAGPVVEDGIEQFDNLVHANEHTSVEEALMKKLNAKCSNRDISSCIMLKLLTYFNRLMKKSQIEIGNVEITQTTTATFEEESNSGRRSNNQLNKLDVENMSDETQLMQVLLDKTWNFARTRSLKWKIIDEADVVISGVSDKDGGLSLDLSLRPTPSITVDGEARKKKDNGMGALIAAAALKIGLLKALAFKALVLLVGKALLVSKLALVLAAVIGLKKLFSHEKHVTYEVVSHPQHEHHEVHGGGHESYGGGGGGGGSWGRNYDTATSLAYRAQVPTAKN